MKKLLILFLTVALAHSGVAQVRPPVPPTLTYRAGNTNELDMLLSSAGSPITPGASVSVTAEIRLSDVGRIIASVPLSVGDTSAGIIRGILPNLAAGQYYLGLYLHYASGEPDFRVGVARINILPTGSLTSVADASGLNVQISRVTQVLSVQLDATPSSAIAAFYAQQARVVVQSVGAHMARTDSTVATFGANIASRVLSKTYTLPGIAPTGYRITHGRNTRLVTAVFFRSDTGQPDALWRIQITSDMYVDAIGVAGETFSGRVVLSFPTQINSN